MPRSTNNSLATTRFEGDSEVVPSSGADVVSSAGSSVLQAGQNISTSSDTLAQAMSKALTDSLPGILVALHNHNAVSSQPAPPLEFRGDLHVVAGSTAASLPRSGHDNRYLYCSFVRFHLFHTFDACLWFFLPSSSIGFGFSDCRGWGCFSLSRHLSFICCGWKRFCNRPWILPHSTQVGNQNHNWSFCGTSGSSARQPQSERV